MHVQLTIDTLEDLSNVDRAVLSALLGQPVVSDDPAPIAVEKAPEPEVEEKPAPKRRGRPRKVEPKEEEVAEAEEQKAAKLKAEADKKEAELKAEAELNTAEESAEETEDEGTPAVLEDDEDAPTLEQAVSRATALISDGKAPAVKKVLNDLGVKKVGELSQSDIQAFLEGLEDA